MFNVSALLLDDANPRNQVGDATGQ